MYSRQSFRNDIEIDTFPDIQLIHNEYHVLMAEIECIGTYRPPTLTLCKNDIRTFSFSLEICGK